MTILAHLNAFMDRPSIAETPLIRRPAQRLPVRLVNAVIGHLNHLGFEREELDGASACREAEQAVALEDFGDDSFRVPLGVLLDSIRQEARLHPIGWMGFRAIIIRRLTIRLEMQAFWKQHPEILQSPITRPLFILGLPRTGTTLLFNLLAQDPAHRWMANWEAISPMPPTNSKFDSSRRRAAMANRILNWSAPEMRRKHEFESEGPDECGPLMWNTFEAELFAFMIDVPTYRRWLYGRDRVAAYRHYRSQLQTLQHTRPGERWLLKWPFHVFNLDALLAVFPDACIVQLHRDIKKVLPSNCSLQSTWRGVYAELIDCGQLGKDTFEHLGYGLDRSMDVRATAPTERFCDVQYSVLMRDPIAVVTDIYRQFDFPLTDAVLDRMRSYLANNPQHKHGAHRYSLEDFGIEPQSVTTRFARYTDRFLVPEEMPAAQA
jgi:hypothetical protein